LIKQPRLERAASRSGFICPQNTRKDAQMNLHLSYPFAYFAGDFLIVPNDANKKCKLIPALRFRLS